MGDARTVRLIISGRVQGVFFRLHTKKEADRIRAKGYVKNLSDGTVEAVIQGTDEEIEEMTLFCKDGPDSAKVDDVKIEEIESDETFDDFSVRY